MLLLFVVLAVVLAGAFAFKRLRRGSIEGSDSYWKLALRAVGSIVVLLALIAFYDFVFPAPPKTLYNFGMMMYGHRPKGTALSLITRACNGGAARACTQLGVMYEEGVAGVQDQDYVKARTAYKKACDGGDLNGCINLGEMFDWGHGGTTDKYLAASYYIKACNGGEMQGCTEVGSIYEMGDLGFTEDLKQALYYIRKACDGGQLVTCRSLGDLYEENEEGAPDHVLAREAYQRACDNPDAESKESCTSLGGLYEKGLGGNMDTAQAKKLYQEACDNINPDAAGCLALGKLYESESSYEQARARYQQACDGGIQEGCDGVIGKKTEESAAAPKVTAPRARVASVASASSAAPEAAQEATPKYDEGAIRFYRKACEGGMRGVASRWANSTRRASASRKILPRRALITRRPARMETRRAAPRLAKCAECDPGARESSRGNASRARTL